MTTTLGAGLDYIDLQFLGERNIIASGLLSGREGVAIVDPGPSTTLPVLKRALTERGVELRDVRAILITHVHLDHAGATGSLVRECPNAMVFVHEIGAPHMANPSQADRQRLAALWRRHGAVVGRGAAGPCRA